MFDFFAEKGYIVARMPDRIDEKSGLGEVSVSEGPTTDSYIARNVARIGQEINATNGITINVEPKVTGQISDPPLLSVEAYKPKPVAVVDNSSSRNLDPIVTARPVQLLRLDDRNAPSSDKMVNLVNYRVRGKGKRKLAA